MLPGYQSLARATAPALLSLLLAAPALAQPQPGCVSSNFNGTDIAAGSTLWFSANFKYSGPTDEAVLIEIDDATIEFEADGVPYSLAVPSAFISLDPAATSSTTEFDESTGYWMTTVPLGTGDDIFLTGLAFPVTVDIPGGTNPVVFCGTFFSSVGFHCLNWKWGAAVYTQFSQDYDALGVAPVHDGVHAGTPTNFTQYVTGGARGGGGSNYTGSWSGTSSVCYDQPVANEAASWGTLKSSSR